MKIIIYSTLAAIILQLFSSMTVAANFTEEFERARQKTELIDDNTEKMLKLNKKWFILMGVIFMGMIYRSLFIPPEK